MKNFARSVAVLGIGVAGLCGSAVAGWGVTIECVMLQNASSGLYVAPWTAYAGSSEGILRADSRYSNIPSDPNALEKFRLWRSGAAVDGALLALQSRRTGNFVAAEMGYSGFYRGVLRARTAPGYPNAWSTIGSWEKFRDPRFMESGTSYFMSNGAGAAVLWKTSSGRDGNGYDDYGDLGSSVYPGSEFDFYYVPCNGARWNLATF